MLRKRAHIGKNRKFSEISKWNGPNGPFSLCDQMIAQFYLEFRMIWSRSSHGIPIEKVPH